MGFFARLFGLSDEASEIAEIAEEIGRYADRFDNAKDPENAAFARAYEARIRRAQSLKQAKILRREFLAIIDKQDYSLHREQEQDLLREQHYENDNRSDNS